MTLSIIIPVYNEEKTIATLLHQLSELELDGVEKEILIVDDGSTDGTSEVITKLISSTKNLKYMRHKKNKGKGAAVRTGLQTATGDYVIIQDADLEYNPKDIPYLLEPIMEGKSKVVYGTRLKRLPNFKRDERTFRFFTHYIGNKLLSLITSVLYGQWITDMETGYKLLPQKVIQDLKLKSYGFELEPEITAKLLKKGFKILELPISTNPRGYNEGKKLNTVHDGCRALWALIKYRISD